MTTATAGNDVKLDLDPMRILTITANLLPAEITDARREHKLRWIVAAVLVVVIVALGFWDFTARQETSDAQSALNRAQAQVNSLEAQQQQFGALKSTKAQTAAISSQLSHLLAQDIPWYQVLPALNTACVNAGVAITNFNAAITDAAATGASTGSGTAATSATTTTGSASSAAQAGTLTLTGLAPDKPQIAALLDQLAKVPGITNPYLTSVTLLNGASQFVVHADFTTALFGGRFTTSTGGK